MAKNLALAAALLLAILSLATATTYTTTVTTTTIDDEANQGRQQECQQELQGRKFQSCQTYFRQGREGGRYELLLALNRGKQSGEYLQECCDEIRQVKEDCRCEAIRQAVKEQQQGGRGFQGEEIQEVYQKARDLPRQCQFNRPQQCQLRAVFV